MRAGLSTQLDSDVPAIGRRPAAEIHRHIDHRAGRDPQQLGLGGGRGLEMEAAHDIGRRGKRLVVLHELDLDPVLAQHIEAEQFGEKTARVAVPNWGDQLDVRDISESDLHGSYLAATAMPVSGLASRELR
jgi:hypothetical protein